MKKNFLLLLLLTLLPLAGWAQTSNPSYEWTSGSAPDLTYGDATPNFGNLVTVLNGWSNYACENYGEGTSYTSTTDTNNRFRWAIFKKSGTTQIESSTTLDAGDYELRLYIRHRSSGGGFVNVTRTLEFTVAKANVEVKLYQVVREWRNPWSKIISEDIDLPALETSAYKVEGADATWAKIVGAMSWNQLQTPEDVGSYKYTLNVDETNDALKNYIVNVNAEGAGLKLEKNTTAYWEEKATDPTTNLTYNGQEQTLAPGSDAVLWDTDDNVAGTIEYSVDGGTTWSADYPKAKDAGTYTIDYKAVDDTNHDNSGVSQESYTVVIDKASTPKPVITAVGGPFTYKATIDESAFTVTKESDGALSYTYEFKAPGETAYTAVAGFDGSAGDWKVWAHQAEGTNWYAMDAETGFEFEVAKANNEFTTAPEKVADWQYDAASHNLLSNLGAVNGGAKIHYHIIYTPFVGSGNYELDTDVMPTGEDAGTYQISYYADATNNYNEIGEKELGTVTVSKATLKVTGVAAKDGLVYNAEAQQLLKSGATVTTSYGVDLASPAEFTIQYNWPNNSVSGWKSVKGTDAGTYEINYQVTPTPKNANNFAIPAAGKVTGKIEKCKVDVAAATKILNYGEYEVTPEMLIIVDADDVPEKETLTPEEIGVIVAKFKDGWTIPNPQDAGAYPFSLEPLENTNYTINKFDPDGGITIKKIPAVPATVAAADLTYTGADQALVTVSGTPEGGTMMYFVGDAAPGVGDSKWETAVPKKTDAGTYKVWTMIKGDKNHEDVVATTSIEAKIKQKNLNTADFTIEPATSAYTGADQKSEIEAAIAVVPDATEPMDVDKDIKSITLPTGEMKAKGEYDVTIEGQGNYTGTTVKKFNITQATNEITAVPVAPEATALVYTGEELPLIGTEGTAKFGTVVYSLSETGTYGAASTIKATDAGTYTVYYKVEGTADYTALNGSFTATITQAPNAVTVSLASWTYGDEAKTPVVTATFAGTDEPKIEYAKAVEEGETPVFGTYAEKVNDQAGSYIVKASVAETSNWAAAEKTATFTIAPKAVTPTEPELLVLTYNGKDQELVSAGSAEGTTIQYALDEGEFGDAIPTAKNAGTYTVHYKFAENPNYTYSKTTGDVNVKILQAKLRFRMGKQEETYTGEAFEPVKGEAYQLAEGGFFVGDEDVLTFAFEEGFDATTACEEGRAFDRLVYTFKDGIANYTVGFENEGLLIIKKANPAEFTAPAAIDLTYNGKAQELVTKGSVAKVDDKPLGTIMFTVSKDGKGEYTTAVPQATDALKYDAQENRPAVWFKVVGDANHKDTEPAKVDNVEIKPYTLTADMIKGEDGKPLPTPYQKPYTAAVQSFPMKLMVKLAADKDPRTLADKTDYTVKINGKEVKDVEIKNAGDYVYTFTGKGNYTGTISTTATITKGELIATAPNAVKTYDGTAVIEPEEFECTATQLKLYGGLEISGLLADDKIDLGGKTIADIIVPEGSAINVGTYNLKVNLAAIPEQANYTFNAQTFNGKLTINKAEAVKIGFFTWEEDPEPNTEEAFWGTKIVKTKEYSKSYGTDDPVFITPNGTNDVTSIAGDLMALEGELFEDNAVVATLLGATRTEGHVYTKDGYTVKLGWKNTSNTAELAKIATFKNNYKNVTFGTTKFFITPYEGTIKVSIKSDAVVFDGKEHADAIAWAEDLSNMVVVGLPANKNKNEIFTELPKITVTPKDGKVRNAGDYNITLSGGKSDNYDLKKVQFVLGSYLTVEPFEITPDMVTIPDQQAKLDDKAKDAIKHDAFEFKDGAVPAAEGVNLYDVFQVVAAPDFVDGNGKIKLGENPAEGLTLARKDNTNAEALNYTGYDEVFGYLAVIGTPNLLVLDDTKDIATKDRENTVVTFTSRTISQDNWNVVCLPFDATIKQISDAFGYAAVDLLKKESVDGSMHFVVTTSGTVPAGEPFIIKPTSDPELNAKKNFDQVKFTGVTVKEFSDNPEPVKDSAGNKFCGTFKAHTYFSGEKFWYMSKSEWKQASNFTEANPVDLGAYRAYIETATAEARIFIEEPDGTITAINAIDLNNNAMDEGWYTVNGMKLNAAPTQKGTYIKDGKKVFVK